MNKTKMLLSVSVLSLLSLNAFATDKNHLYVEGNLGYSRVAAPGLNANNTTTEPETGNLGAGINLGYARSLNQAVALGAEAGADYNGYSEVKPSPPGNAGPEGKITENDLHLLLTSNFNLVSPEANSPVNLFAKAGIAHVTQKMTGAGSANNGSDSAYTPITTVGLGYMLTDAVNMHLQYTHIFGNDQSQLPTQGPPVASFNNVGSVNTISLGTSYDFLN